MNLNMSTHGTQTTLPWFEGQMPLQPIADDPPDVCSLCGGTAYLKPEGICEDCLDSFYACHPFD